MDQTNLYKDPPLLIHELMQVTFGQRFNAYFLGSPTEIPEAAFPCVVVQSIQSSNTIKGAPTGTDRVGELIHVHFLENQKDNLGASDSVDTTIRKLYNRIQGRDPATGFYLPGTAMYALRTNITLQNASGVDTVIDQDITIDYEITPRADHSVITEAIVTVLTTERVRVIR